MAMIMVLSSLFSNGAVAHETDEVWFLYSNEDGTFWLDYNEDMDVVFHIDDDTLNEWKVNKDELQYGFKMNGIMDDEFNFIEYTGKEQIEAELIPIDVKDSIDTNIEYGMMEYKYIDIWYMYSVDDGSYFLDTAAEYENVIWVDDESLKDWGIDKEGLHHGNKMTGIFTPDGWELLSMIE